ncbi:glycoside hydrolase family 16 protein [Kineosporia rhizophila]|uniref:glycoside hydrolase family 16 protein n=1 Tax=Kineosporia rhizophila TaxID=84633 RepID=UPI001E4C7869|nr:glycoside hydrolase family 16 protein [Kineosporia rhizophila]MCE0533936.1 glycoside hydrolase family 16 protein [Kineosporia rhizophila]
MKKSLTRKSLKNARRRRVYLVTASLTALVLAAGGTAMAVQGGSRGETTTAAATQDEVSTVAYGKRSAYPASDGPRKHWKKKYKKKRPTATSTPSETATTEPTAPETTQPSDNPTTAPSATTSPSSTSTAPSGATPVFAGKKNTEDWASNVSSLYQKYARGGSSVTGGVGDTAAKDGKALNLTIPAGAGASPGNAAEVASKEQFLYGSFSSRVKTADCSAQPKTGAVTGIFTYGNDGTDQDGDGLTDNSEIDVEVLCARPDVVNLTIYTDYEDSTAKSQRVSRIIDLAAGKVISTCYYTDFSGNCVETLSGDEASPATVPAIRGFDSSKNYYDYKIDWTKDNVRFTITDEAGQETTLWDYQGPAERIPNRPASYLVNFWHTSDWAAHERPGTTQSPTSPLTVSVDSSTSTALS